MARFFLDLLILGALCKEVFELARGQVLGLGSFLTALLALSFFLGIAPSEGNSFGIVRNPIRNLIRTGIALVSLVFYWQVQFLNGVWWQFGGLYAVAIGVYLIGRWLGLVWRAIWFVLGMLLAVYLYLHLVRGG